MITRLIAAAALASVLACGSAIAAETPAGTDAQAVTAETKIDRDDARRIAKEDAKQNSPRGTRVGQITAKDGGYEVVLTSPEGFPIRKLQIDSSGKVS